MNKRELDELAWKPASEGQWTPEDKPVLVLDGVAHRISELRAPLAGKSAYVVGVADRQFESLCERLDAEVVQFYEMRVAYLTPLSRIHSLRALAIRWNTKVADLAPLAVLHELRALVLDDTPKAHDLEPIGKLTALERLDFQGGVWSANTAETLEPLARLPRLRELSLYNLKVVHGGLRPLAACRALRRLQISNQFPTEDYAYLSVVLRETECSSFAPYVRLASPIAGKDAMVVGRRKPLLHSVDDAPRLARYEREFRDLQEKYAAESR